MNLRQLPNTISIFRVVLVFPIIYLLLNHQYQQTLVLFVIAGVSDGVDGFLAKHYGWQTWLGGVLDPLADKFLLVSCFIALAWMGMLSWWLVALVMVRDVVIIAGATYYYFRVDRIDAQPTFLSKFNTVSQIGLVVVVILSEIVSLPSWLVTTMIIFVALTTVSSGLDYVVAWSRRAQKHPH
ncbi:MAG: CDP-alcohol phosphatidyltransferase family protein [Pseudomonadota bacterium]|nr:CDP-alcohol phosphatidyltransferase family protein [Pseudomonadota bacterium]